MASVRQLVRAWKESASGQGTDYAKDPFVVPESPVKNTDFWCWRITDPASFAVRKQPKQKIIRSADSYNRKVQDYSSQYDVTGAFTTPFYPEQANLWSYLLTPDSTTNDLPSIAVDQAIEQVDGSMIYQRYLGLKAQSVVFTATADSNMWVVSGQLIGKMVQTTALTSTDFADIVASFYPAPASYPYKFTDIGGTGYLKLNNANQSECNSVTLTVTNILDGTWSQDTTVSRVRYCGRDVTMNANFVLKDNTYRSWFEGVTTLATANGIKLDNGTNTFAVSLGTSAYVTDVSDDLSFSTVHRQSVGFTNVFDGSADLAFTVT